VSLPPGPVSLFTTSMGSPSGQPGIHHLEASTPPGTAFLFYERGSNHCLGFSVSLEHLAHKQPARMSHPSTAFQAVHCSGPGTALGWRPQGPLQGMGTPRGRPVEQSVEKPIPGGIPVSSRLQGHIKPHQDEDTEEPSGRPLAPFRSHGKQLPGLHHLKRSTANVCGSRL
jgi:hypothetical protein